MKRLMVAISATLITKAYFSSFFSRVFKGMRMAGQTGNKRVKIQNLQVLKIVPEKNLLVLSGAVPGAKGSFVRIEK